MDHTKRPRQSEHDERDVKRPYNEKEKGTEVETEPTIPKTLSFKNIIPDLHLIYPVTMMFLTSEQRETIRKDYSDFVDAMNQFPDNGLPITKDALPFCDHSSEPWMMKRFLHHIRCYTCCEDPLITPCTIFGWKHEDTIPLLRKMICTLCTKRKTAASARRIRFYAEAIMNFFIPCDHKNCGKSFAWRRRLLGSLPVWDFVVRAVMSSINVGWTTDNGSGQRTMEAVAKFLRVNSTHSDDTLEFHHLTRLNEAIGLERKHVCRNELGNIVFITLLNDPKRWEMVPNGSLPLPNYVCVLRNIEAPDLVPVLLELRRIIKLETIVLDMPLDDSCKLCSKFLRHGGIANPIKNVIISDDTVLDLRLKDVPEYLEKITRLLNELWDLVVGEVEMRITLSRLTLRERFREDVAAFEHRSCATLKVVTGNPLAWNPDDDNRVKIKNLMVLSCR